MFIICRARCKLFSAVSQFVRIKLADELPGKLSALRLVSDAAKGERGDFTIRRLTMEDKEPVLKFLTKYFFHDEPMNKAVNLLETPESRCTALEEYTLGSLEEGVSVAAVDDRGALVGVIVNGIAEKSVPVDMSKKVAECPDPKFSRVLRVLAHLEEQAGVWKQVGDASRVMEVRIASTAEEWRGRGLMRVLCDETEKLARKMGCGALRMDATSAFSAAAAERLGYKKIYSVAFEDVEGGPLPKPPHKTASVYIKII